MYPIVLLFLSLYLPVSSFLISFYAHKESISELFSEQPNPFKITALTSTGALFEIIGVSALCINHVSPALTL